MKKKKEGLTRGLIITLAFFAVILTVGVLLVRSISNYSNQAETDTVDRAVRSAMATCYAVEGAYPDDIDYLRRYYNLTWDDDVYIVTYDAFASNIMPDIQVLEKGGYQP